MTMIIGPVNSELNGIVERGGKAISDTTIRWEGGRVLVDVHVVPRASRSALAGEHGGRIKVLLAAPPVDDKANQALIELVAKALRCPKRNVELIRGHRDRHKTLAIADVGIADVIAVLRGEE